MREKIDVGGRIHVPRSADWAYSRCIPLPIIAVSDNFLPFSSTFSPLERGKSDQRRRSNQPEIF